MDCIETRMGFLDPCGMGQMQEKNIPVLGSLLARIKDLRNSGRVFLAPSMAAVC